MNISIIVQHVRVLLHGHLFSLKIIPWDISPVFRNAGWDISRILRVEHAITAIKNALLAIWKQIAAIPVLLPMAGIITPATRPAKVASSYLRTAAIVRHAIQPAFPAWIRPIAMSAL